MTLHEATCGGAIDGGALPPAHYSQQSAILFVQNAVLFVSLLLPSPRLDADATEDKRAARGWGGEAQGGGGR